MFLLCNSLPSTPRHTSINTIHCHATWRLWYPPPSPTLVSFYQFYDMALTPPTPCLRRRCPPSSSLLDGNCIMRILTTVAFAMTTTTVFSLPNGDGDGVLLSPFPPPIPDRNMLMMATTVIFLVMMLGTMAMFVAVGISSTMASPTPSPPQMATAR